MVIADTFLEVFLEIVPPHSFLVTDGSDDRFLKFYFLMLDKKVHEFFKILKLWGFFSVEKLKLKNEKQGDIRSYIM